MSDVVPVLNLTATTATPTPRGTSRSTSRSTSRNTSRSAVPAAGKPSGLTPWSSRRPATASSSGRFVRAPWEPWDEPPVQLDASARARLKGSDTWRTPASARTGRSLHSYERLAPWEKTPRGRAEMERIITERNQRRGRLADCAREARALDLSARGRRDEDALRTRKHRAKALEEQRAQEERRRVGERERIEAERAGLAHQCRERRQADLEERRRCQDDCRKFVESRRVLVAEARKERTDEMARVNSEIDAFLLRKQRLKDEHLRLELQREQLRRDGISKHTAFVASECRERRRQAAQDKAAEQAYRERIRAAHRDNVHEGRFAVAAEAAAIGAARAANMQRRTALRSAEMQRAQEEREHALAKVEADFKRAAANTLKAKAEARSDARRNAEEIRDRYSRHYYTVADERARDAAAREVRSLPLRRRREFGIARQHEKHAEAKAHEQRLALDAASRFTFHRGERAERQRDQAAAMEWAQSQARARADRRAAERSALRSAGKVEPAARLQGITHSLHVWRKDRARGVHAQARSSAASARHPYRGNENHPPPSGGVACGGGVNAAAKMRRDDRATTVSSGNGMLPPKKAHTSSAPTLSRPPLHSANAASLSRSKSGEWATRKPRPTPRRRVQ